MVRIANFTTTPLSNAIVRATSSDTTITAETQRRRHNPIESQIEKMDQSADELAGFDDREQHDQRQCGGQRVVEPIPGA